MSAQSTSSGGGGGGGSSAPAMLALLLGVLGLKNRLARPTALPAPPLTLGRRA